MATSSMLKEFKISDRNAFEQFVKNTETDKRQNDVRKVKESSSLKYGEEKLKNFSFR